VRHNTHPGPSPHYSPCDSVSTKPRHQHLRLPSPSKLGISSSPTLTLAPSYVSLAELLPTPVYVSHTKLPLPPAYVALSDPPLPPRLRLPLQTASTLSYVTLAELLLPPVYVSLTEPPPASPRSPSPPPSPPLPRLPHRTASASTQLPSTTLPLDWSCPVPIPLVPSPPGPTHDLARTPIFGFSGVLFHIPGSLSPPLKIPGIIPKE